MSKKIMEEVLKNLIQGIELLSNAFQIALLEYQNEDDDNDEDGSKYVQRSFFGKEFQ